MDFPRLPGLGTLIKNAWTFYKNNLSKLWPMLLLIILPAAINIVLGDKTIGIVNIAQSPSFVTVSMVLGIVLSIVAAIASIAFVKAVIQLQNNTFVNTQETYVSTIRGIGSIIWISILSMLIVFGGYALFLIPGIILSVYFFSALYVYFDEDKRGFAALTRSYELIKDYWWAFFGRTIGLTFVFMVCMIPLMVLISVVAAMGRDGGSSAAITAAIFGLIFVVIINGLFTPVSQIFFVGLYRELKRVKADRPVDQASTVRFVRFSKIMIGLAILTIALGIAAGIIAWKYIEPFIYNKGTFGPSAIVNTAATIPMSTTTSPLLVEPGKKLLSQTAYINEQKKYQIYIPLGWKMAEDDVTGNDYAVDPTGAIEAALDILNIVKVDDLDLSDEKTQLIIAQTAANTSFNGFDQSEIRRATFERVSPTVILAEIEVMTLDTPEPVVYSQFIHFGKMHAGGVMITSLKKDLIKHQSMLYASALSFKFIE